LQRINLREEEEEEGGYWRSTIQYHSGIGFYGKKLRKYQEE
jgi:hypothetical protein